MESLRSIGDSSSTWTFMEAQGLKSPGPPVSIRLRRGGGRVADPGAVREIYRHPAFRLPFLRRFSAMTLAPFWILYREAPDEVDPRTRRHEAEHLAQARRVGLLTFYGTYLWDWVRGVVRTRSLDAAYRQIRWEAKAYAAQHDPCWPTECPDLARGDARASIRCGQTESRTRTPFGTGS